MFFAIKWIGDNGSEMLYSGRDISFTPRGICVAPPGATKSPAMVTFYDPNETFCSFDSGRVFVMNDRGTTISDWRLSALNVDDTIQRTAA